MRLSDRAWRIPVGAQFRFRVAVHAVRRNGRSKTERVVAPEDAQAWLLERLSPAVTDVEILNQYRTRTESTGRRPAPARIDPDTFDGVGVVKDARAFDALRLAGVGRAKSYGCGLLTAQQISTG